MKYKAIGFDYGGVIKGLPGADFTNRISELLGVTPDQYRDAYFAYNKKVNRGEVTWQELWELVLTDLGKQHLVNEVMELSNSRLYQEINDEILELADDLRKRGYKTGLLSNNTIAGGKLMREEGIDKFFDVFHVSAETGYVKPEIEAFANFTHELGIEPDELVFIDDAEKSLSTAGDCGFTPILFKSREQLIEDLKRLEVL